MSVLTRRPTTLNDASRAQVEIARDLARHCPPQMGQEIAVGGAAARGLADQFSGIELNLWVEKLPNRLMRDAWVNGLGGKHITHQLDLTPNGVISSVFRYKGMWITTHWQTFTSLENTLGGILAAQIVEAERFNFADLITQAIVLREKGNLSRAKNMLLSYPEAVQSRVIAHVIAAWRLPHVMQTRWLWLAQGEHVPLMNLLVEDIYNGLRILYAVNRTWEPERQWIRPGQLAFPRMPERWRERLDQIMAMPLYAENITAHFELLAEIAALAPGTGEVRTMLKKLSISG